VNYRRSRRTGHLHHTRREVVRSRPVHITTRVHDDVPTLRDPEVLKYFRQMVVEARRRGVRTVAFALMPSHLHWLVIPDSAAALQDATRYAFGHLARFINRRHGRRGKVFVERYASSCCASVRHAFQVLNYVLKNAAAAGYRLPARGLDPFSAVFEDVLAGDRFLRSVVGPTPALRWALLHRMARGAVPFVPVAERCQPRLPGL